jgi:hypothetical protein
MIKSRVFGNTHPNIKEAKSIIAYYKENYAVVLYVDYRSNLVLKNIDLLFGFGECYGKNLERSVRHVYYATGSSASFVRVEVSKRKAGLPECMKSGRFWRVSDFVEVENERRSSNILNIGNSVTRSSFESSKVIRNLPGIALGNKVSSNRNKSENAILFFAGKGIYHKGLDIACQVAKNLERKLMIIAARDVDYDEINRLTQLGKIKVEIFPFIEVDSPAWLETIHRGKFAIFPSISDGMNTTVLTVVKYGVYPIVTDRTGCDIGSVIRWSDPADLVEEFTNELNRLEKMPSNVLSDQIAVWSNTIAVENSVEAFKKSVKINLNYFESLY